jgi:hypothetical protein
MRSTGQSPPLASTSGRQAVVEPGHRIDRLERRNDGKAVLERIHWPVAPLIQPARGGVAVEPDQQGRALRARTGKVRDVATVQDVEDAVGEHQRPLQLGDPTLQVRRRMNLGLEGG